MYVRMDPTFAAVLEISFPLSTVALRFSREAENGVSLDQVLNGLSEAEMACAPLGPYRLRSYLDSTITVACYA